MLIRLIVSGYIFIIKLFKSWKKEEEEGRKEKTKKRPLCY